MPYKDFYGREQVSVSEWRAARDLQAESKDKQRLADIRAEARRQVVSDPEFIRQQQEHERKMEETLRSYALAQIFRTHILIEGKPHVAIQNKAAENIIINWLHPGESLTSEWFVRVVRDPALATQLSWKVILTPEEQNQNQVKQRKIFKNAAKALRTFGVNEANFGLTRSTLGDSFSEYSIQQALTSNALRLSPPSQDELDQWAAEDVEAKNQSLLKADPEQLRARVRDEATARHQATKQAEADLQLKAAQQRDAVMGFPPLPQVWQGHTLDAAFIKTCSVETHKLLTKRFGAAQLTARLRGVA